MNYLSVEKLTKSVADKMLFKDITFGISKGARVALIAKNGTGKSTLLSCLKDPSLAESGLVSFRSEIRVGYLSQEPDFTGCVKVDDAVFNSENPLVGALREYNASMNDVDDVDRMQRALTLMDELNAWDYEAKISEILSKLGIDNREQFIDELSGGQKKRVSLAMVLIDDPDFLVLDEPTNHLDPDVIEWLEDYLASNNKTILMVTHDRFFLECVCNEILELDDNTIYKYTGNYSYYLEKRSERKANDSRVTEKARSLMKTELEWVRRQPKARGTKAKYRMEAFDDLKDKAKGKAKDKNLDLEIQSSRMGKKILEVHDIKKSWGDQIITDGFSYVFKKNEKIGIVGENGVGKTTFLNLLTGKEECDSGEVEPGVTVKVGFYQQQGMKFDESMKVIDVVKNIADYIPMGDGSMISASQMLERFLFAPETQYNFVYKLSGGERRRLYLLTILMANPNFLILDEPTNDLDIVTLNVLEDYLINFQGCVLIVSHDRYFMDKIVDHLFIFEGEGVIKDYNGKFTEYLAYKKDKALNKIKEPKDKVKTKEKVEEGRKLSFAEKKEYETLEKEIANLELKKAEIEKLLGIETAADKLTDLSKDFGLLEKEIEQKSERWLELAEFI